MQKFLSELQRRKVLRVATGYVIAGWVILQVALSLQAAMTLPAWFSSAIMAVLLIGFPLAVFASWFFEFTPEGIRRTVPSDEIVPLKFQATDLALAAALILVLAAVAVKVVSPTQETTVAAAPAAPVAPQPSAASIAVLPFADLSPAKDQEYFSDGMAEEILNVLAKVKGLHVASRTSAFQFKGREIGVPEIARQLKVRHVVEGSVRKAGDTLRITAQLIDTSSDRHLWSETFDRPLTTDNIFTIQDEIAKAIVKALGQTMGAATGAEVAVAPVTDNVTAYEHFLQARRLFTARIDLDKADALLTRAVEQDPNFAGAWEMRAALQSLMVDYGYSSAAPEVWEPRTIEFADRALAINPKSATAIATLARRKMSAAAALRERGDYAAIIEYFNRALAIDPQNTSALNWLGITYRDLGDMKSALTTFKRCMDIDPFYVPCVGNTMNALGSLGRDAEALAVYRSALDAGMSNVRPPLGVLIRHGMDYEFKLWAGSPNTLYGWRRLGELYEAYRHPERGHSALIADIRSFNQKSGFMSETEVAVIVVPIGAGDRMANSIIAWDPLLSRYRRSAAFKTQIMKSGVFDYWKKHGFPPPCKPVGAGDFACD